jgi:hypothetical protein
LCDDDDDDEDDDDDDGGGGGDDDDDDDDDDNDDDDDDDLDLPAREAPPCTWTASARSPYAAPDTRRQAGGENILWRTTVTMKMILLF